MSGSGDNQSTEEIAAKEAQERERELKASQEITGKAPSRSNGESSNDSSSDSDSSDEDVKDDGDAVKKAAKKRRKAKKKKAKKMAKKLLKKMIKKEQAKYTHFGYYEVPRHYTQFLSNNSKEKFYSEYIWESLLISMGKTIPNGLMICKCTSTGFTLLFGRLWL
jgi:hypothetical protein